MVFRRISIFDCLTELDVFFVGRQSCMLVYKCGVWKCYKDKSWPDVILVRPLTDVAL